MITHNGYVIAREKGFIGPYFYEMYQLGWLTEGQYIECVEWQDAHLGFAYSETPEYRRMMAYSDTIIDELCQGHFFSNSRIEENKNNLRYHKANDKPIASGQPRRFTKGFIGVNALLFCFQYDVYKNNITSIQELEKYVDTNYESKYEIWAHVYSQVFPHAFPTSNKVPILSKFENYHIAGAGIYDDFDGYLCNKWLGWGFIPESINHLTIEQQEIIKTHDPEYYNKLQSGYMGEYYGIPYQELGVQF